MELESKDYDLVIRYLDNSASEEDLRLARELLLRSPEARAFLMEVAGQMVYLIDRHRSFVELPDAFSIPPVCSIYQQSVATIRDVPKNAGQKSKWLSSKTQKIGFYIAASFMIVALFFSAVAFLSNSKMGMGREPSLQLTDYLGELTVKRGRDQFKSPFRELLGLSAGDIIETNSWLSWGEWKVDSGATLTVLANSRIRIDSLTASQIRVELLSGAIRIKSINDDSFEFLVSSDRMNVKSTGADTLVWDYNFVPALTASFSGRPEVSSIDETQHVRLDTGLMASIDYNEEKFRISPHPKIVHGWSSVGMKSSELGTGMWKETEEPGKVKLLASPKSYIYPGGQLFQIDEVLIAVWRRPGMVRLKGGSRLIVTGRYTKPGPVTFALRTHSEYGKLLDIFAKTLPANNLAAPGDTWRVEIPVEAMQSTFRPGKNPNDSLVFNISAFTSEKIGLEVNSVDLIPPE